MKINTFNKRTLLLLFVVIFFYVPLQTNAQFANKWINVGSMHNWFSEIGSEIEHGFVASQQYGLQWPAFIKRQDSQAAKGLWLGTIDFTDERGDFYPHKVVHVGPRVTGVGEFYPMRFDMISKFDPPKVFVDGVLSFEKVVDNDMIDASMDADRMLINVTNCQIGVTMTRKIMAFSQQHHDNYMIYEYTFKNTGNIDDDEEIELPNNTLNGFYVFTQYRYASCRQTRHVIGNGTGWGMNTMLDARGDGPVNPGLYGDPADEQFRAQFSWHGYFPDKTVDYDNIGGPIWAPYEGFTAETDTIGRIGAPQFVGVVTLYADDPNNIGTDSPEQPSTTGYYGSDLPETGSGRTAYDIPGMRAEYIWMSKGHMSPRHAWKVQPDGNFAEQTTGANIEPGKPGGFSIGDGYGPYTLGPGDSIRIVMAEAAAGLGTKLCIDVGRDYKRGLIDAKTKNEWVLTGKDSLFQTFRRAIDNFENGYNIPEPPKPPKLFSVDGGGDRISLSWEVDDDPTIQGFRIYRYSGEYNNPMNPPALIYEAGAGDRAYSDQTPVRGVGYYYYIISVGQTVTANPTLGIPATTLVSSRYYTHSYDPAFLKRPAGNDINAFKIVPNPYIISSSADRLRFSGEPDKLAFFNIPGQCTIQIFTEIGELVNTIEHNDGSGDAYWKAVTSSNQIVVSGVYIAVVTDNVTGERAIKKFVIIR